MDVMLVTFLAIFGFVPSCFILRYFFFLCEPKDTPNKKTHIVVIGALISTIALVCTMWWWSDGTAILVICIMLAIITVVANRENGGASLWGLWLSSGLLNVSSAYGMVYAVCRIVNLLPWVGADYVFRTIVMCLTLLIDCGAVLYLMYSGHFPNEALRGIMHDRIKKLPLLMYLFVFSLGNLSTIYIMNPELAKIELTITETRKIYGDLFLKEAIILAGSYFTVLYLCRLYQSESQSEGLKMALTRESAYRKNQSIEDIATYCIDIDEDRFLEGGENFKDFFKEIGEISYSKTFQITNRYFVHPEDVQKLVPYLKKETLLPYMQNNPIREETIRISKNSIEKHTLGIDQKQKEQTENMMYRLKNSDSEDNEWIWVSARYSLTEDSYTGKHYLYISIRNINESKKEELLLKENAERDALTGLYNRGYFKKHVEEQLASDINCGCIYMIDADHLKQVNDLLGHAEGDRMLINVASILKKEFRSEDIVARLGGDEFVVFAPGLQNVREIQRRADKINQSGRRSYQAADGKTVYTSLSIGISFFPLHGENLDDLMNNADKALYAVKSTTRDAYKIFE